MSNIVQNIENILNSHKLPKYRGKYPNRVCGYAGTCIYGVYSVQTNARQTFYIASSDMIAAGYKTSMQQAIGLDITDLPFAFASLEPAVRKHEANIAARKAAQAKG